MGNPDRRPGPGETCCIPSPEVQKRAALLFDRIVVVTESKHSLEDLGIPTDFTFGFEEADRVYEQTFSEELQRRRKDFFKLRAAGSPTVGEEVVARAVPAAYSRFGIEVIPVFRDEAAFGATFESGPQIGYQAALINLPIVIEDAVAWEQVVDFRSDREAVRKYRDMRLWLREGLEAQSLAHARDLIAQKVDDYEWAIEKHGLMTGTVLSLRYWIGNQPLERPWRRR